MHVDSDLSAYLDAELAPADRSRVEAHLDECERCRARLGELRATATLLRALPTPKAARSLVPRVIERYNWLRPLRSFSTFATGAFLMVFLVTAVGRSGSGLGGGPDVPFGRTTTGAGGAPAAATAGPESAAFATARSAPVPAAAPAAAPQASAAVDAALRATASPGRQLEEPAKAASGATTASPRAEAFGSPVADAREPRREPPPFTDPLMWLGFAVVAAGAAILAHWRLRTA